MTQTWPEESPDKNKSPLKKAKFGEPAPEPQMGPGGFAILDLARDGDCGWRCVSFAVSFANNKGFNDQPQEVAKLQRRIKDIAQVLRTRVFHRLAEDNSWREFWAADPTATELTEAGSIPKCLDEFLQATMIPA